LLNVWWYGDHMPNVPHSECSSEGADGIYQRVTLQLLSILHVFAMWLSERGCYVEWPLSLIPRLVLSV